MSDQDVKNQRENDEKEIPLRFLALENWSEINISLCEYEKLRTKILFGEFPKFNKEYDEIIVRACHLLFSLIDSGGLCRKKPHLELNEAVIDVEAILNGCFRVPVKQVKSKEIEQMEDENISDTDEESLDIQGILQPLHQIGRLHLLIFAYYRIYFQQAKNGDRLLPILPKSKKELLKNTSITWLKNCPNTKWSTIFTVWITEEIRLIRGLYSLKTTTSFYDNLRLAANWRLLEIEKFPIISAYRQNLWVYSS